MKYLKKEIMEKIISLPLHEREKVVEGLVKMLVQRPKDRIRHIASNYAPTLTTYQNQQIPSEDHITLGTKPSE